MKDMLYDFIAIVVIVGLVTIFLIGKNDSIKSNMETLGKSTTKTITELTE
ncbi:hypothetical protein [Anaerovorax sp. IOR16]|nr:hypothetical protein [Anaerovorax sp. IOR16]